MISQIITESRGKLCALHTHTKKPVQAIPMPSGRGVGTLLVRVRVLGNEALENRNGRLVDCREISTRRNGRILQLFGFSCRLRGYW